MDEKFVASNGVVVQEWVTAGWLQVGNPYDLMSAIPEGWVVALREFFLAERDEELGRWRWAEYPEYIVYPVAPGEVYVTSETGGAGKRVRRGEELNGNYLHDAAKAYFEAHPERKPWHDAKEGEVWELTSSENRQYHPGLWAVVSDGKFVFKNAYGSGFDRIPLDSDWEWKRVYPRP